MYRRLIPLLFCLLFSAIKTSFCQVNYFPFYTTDSTRHIKLSEELSLQVGKSFIVPEKVSSDYKKEYKQEKDYSTEYVKWTIKTSVLLDSVINPFVQSVFGKITDANPGLKKYTVVVSDFPMMNAAYFGGNVIVFYTPLLSRLKNENEVAAYIRENQAT